VSSSGVRTRRTGRHPGRAFKGLDVKDRLTDFPAPTLVMTGELDQSTTPKIMTAVAERITGSSYRELPGIPHMQTLEQADVVADALGDFLPAG
jgi:3-oxoadipate enol-lactonase